MLMLVSQAVWSVQSGHQLTFLLITKFLLFPKVIMHQNRYTSLNEIMMEKMYCYMGDTCRTRVKYDFTAEVSTVRNYTFYNYTSGYIHQYLISDLEYDTKYYYEIGEGYSARSFWFETPPKIDPNASYKFGIIGDLGQTYNSLSTLEHYIQSGAQTVLHIGDLSYADRYTYHDMGVCWDSYGRFAEKSAAYQPWVWTVGIHEIEYEPYMNEVVPFKQYLYRYPTPYAARESSSPIWYAVRCASANMIVLSGQLFSIWMRLAIE